jgi:hypothetical protein
MVRRATQLWVGGRRPVLADPFYYLNNFRAVLESLESRYGNLLAVEEREFVRQFHLLPKPASGLAVRMIMRRGILFRRSRLKYQEIGDVAAAAAPLLKLGWLEEPLLDVEALHRLLTKAELMVNLALPRAVARLNKPDLLEVLRARHAEQRPFRDWCANLGDQVFRVVVKPLAERFRLLFFGNFHQDWTTFIRSDLGISSYETVPVHSMPFRTRAHIESFYQLHSCRLALEDGTYSKDIVESIPAPILDSDWLEEQRRSLLFDIAKAYERSEETASALSVYAACRYRGARMRIVRLLERRQDWEAARELCLVAASSPESEAERQLIRRALPRLNRKFGIAEHSPRETPQVAAFDLQLDVPLRSQALELQVRDHLAKQEAGRSTVHYVENALINSLFGLLCWDVIFAPLAGAFFHDFQYGPADLDSPHFFERRRDRFAECFAELESGGYKRIMRQRLTAKAGIQSPFVAWGLLSERLLDCALQCFPARHLRLWFEWIVRDVV